MRSSSCIHNRSSQTRSTRRCTIAICSTGAIDDDIADRDDSTGEFCSINERKNRNICIHIQFYFITNRISPDNKTCCRRRLFLFVIRDESAQSTSFTYTHTKQQSGYTKSTTIRDYYPSRISLFVLTASSTIYCSATTTIDVLNCSFRSHVPGSREHFVQLPSIFVNRSM